MSSTADKVWNVLVDPELTKKWASHFSEGTYVETDWKKGSLVVWKDFVFVVGCESKNLPRASSFAVQKTRYCSTQSDTADKFFKSASQYRSRPCCRMMISPHSDKILMCFEIAGRLTSKFSATAFRFKDCCDRRLIISLRVGSAIAWKTSRLIKFDL